MLGIDDDNVVVAADNDDVNTGEDADHYSDDDDDVDPADDDVGHDYYDGNHSIPLLQRKACKISCSRFMSKS